MCSFIFHIKGETKTSGTGVELSRILGPVTKHGVNSTLLPIKPESETPASPGPLIGYVANSEKQLIKSEIKASGRSELNTKYGVNSREPPLKSKSMMHKVFMNN